MTKSFLPITVHGSALQVAVVQKKNYQFLNKFIFKIDWPTIKYWVLDLTTNKTKSEITQTEPIKMTQDFFILIIFNFFTFFFYST